MAERRKSKGDQKPGADLEKKRATVAQLVRVYNNLNAQHKKLDDSMRDGVRQLYENEEELKQGMNAAEFNLRAHQKAFNAMALELERLRQFMVALLPESPTKGELEEPILQMSDVPLPMDDGEDAVVVRRVNWPYYHGQVEKDLKLLAEVEAEQAEAEAKEEEAPVAPPPEDDGIPEGAAVFGGS